jgi:predicted RNase H-like HicB family nuclease
MKYPILHFEQRDDGFYEEFPDEPKTVESAVVRFREAEYTIAKEEYDEGCWGFVARPHNEIIGAIFDSSNFWEHNRHSSDEQVMRTLQECLQNLDETGKSAFIDSKYWSCD